MKALLLLALAPSAAFACPNLAGTFACPAQQDEPAYTLTVAQSVENGATVYLTHTVDANGKTGDDRMIADGLPHTVPNDNGPAIDFTYTCEGDASLHIDMAGDHPQIGHISGSGSVSLDSRAGFHVVMDVNVGNFGAQHVEETCTRL